MSACKPITIVGGGLAGLTLGIALRRRCVPVTIHEAGHYPRHRVCGEFISGDGQKILRRLELIEPLMAAGAMPARTTAFFSSRAASPLRELPAPALSVSRYVLDATLARRFRELGGDLRENDRWHGTEYPEGTVRASGRRAQPVTGGWRWFGLKVHARNVPLNADLEMHLAPSGYVGMSRLPGGEVNICGLFRRAAGVSETALSWRETLRGVPGSPRYNRLAQAEFDEASFCSVAGLSLEPHRAATFPECCVGDSITMTPPVTGNGMSMAFESADLAVDPLTAYSTSQLDWTEMQQTIARRCDEHFSRRLAWAGVAQRVMFLSGLQDALVLLVPRVPLLWRSLVRHTR